MCEAPREFAGRMHCPVKRSNADHTLHQSVGASDLRVPSRTRAADLADAYSINRAGLSYAVKVDIEIFKESVHSQQSRDGEVFLEPGAD